MWSNFVFNTPYDGISPEIINGAELPDEYIEFMKLHNGGEGDTGESWLVLFPVEELEEINNDYEIYEYIEGCFIIGSDGAGELLGINKDGKYFIVPDMLEEEYLTIIGERIEDLTACINYFWKQN